MDAPVSSIGSAATSALTLASPLTSRTGLDQSHPSSAFQKSSTGSAALGGASASARTEFSDGSSASSTRSSDESSNPAETDSGVSAGSSSSLSKSSNAVTSTAGGSPEVLGLSKLGAECSLPYGIPNSSSSKDSQGSSFAGFEDVLLMARPYPKTVPPARRGALASGRSPRLARELPKTLCER